MSVFRPFSFAAALLCLGASAQAQPTAADIAALTASDAVRQLCAGPLASEQLVTAYLAQAKGKASLNAFITLDEGGALRAARAADAGRKRGGACKRHGVRVRARVSGRGSEALTGARCTRGK